MPYSRPFLFFQTPLQRLIPAIDDKDSLPHASTATTPSPLPRDGSCVLSADDHPKTTQGQQQHRGCRNGEDGHLDGTQTRIAIIRAQWYVFRTLLFFLSANKLQP